ncbi:hypothetical protein D3C87_1544600 [compost metagenome]
MPRSSSIVCESLNLKDSTNGLKSDSKYFFKTFSGIDEINLSQLQYCTLMLYFLLKLKHSSSIPVSDKNDDASINLLNERPFSFLYL